MLIYKITSPSTDLVYVGKTNLTLGQRFGKHNSDYRVWLAGKRKAVSSYKVLEHGDARIELIEETEDASGKQREVYWINAIPNTCNQLRSINFDHASYSRARYVENKEEINAKRRQKVPCPKCGRVVCHGDMAKHQRTKVCQDHAV